MYNHRYVSKVYLYSHDIYKGSMHNKRFIILNQVCSRVLFFGLAMKYCQVLVETEHREMTN